jgi:hypothetical protein
MTAHLELFRNIAFQTLQIDRVTASTWQALEDAGIPTLVIKGPVIAEWLYRGGDIRNYGDSDLMVAPADWDRAVEVLLGLGFADEQGEMAHPRMESFRSYAWVRGEQHVDLHCALWGLDADFETQWRELSDGAGRQNVGGAMVRVPRPAVRLLHIGLHAAHHHEGKALEDVRRALALLDEGLWRDAVGLALRVDGLAAFATGLRLLPEGKELAERLGIADKRSVVFDLRTEDTPTAEALNELLDPELPWRERARTIGRELFPRPSFMRWWSPLATRGPLGLLASYPYRWGWLVVKVPAGLLAVRRARRANARTAAPG